MRKVGINKNLSDEAPFDLVINLFKVHFNSHITHLALFVTNGMNKLLDHNSIIHTSPTRNKSRLKGGDKLVKMRY